MAQLGPLRQDVVLIPGMAVSIRSWTPHSSVAYSTQVCSFRPSLPLHGLTQMFRVVQMCVFLVFLWLDVLVWATRHNWCFHVMGMLSSYCFPAIFTLPLHFVLYYIIFTAHQIDWGFHFKIYIMRSKNEYVSDILHNMNATWSVWSAANV